MSISNKNTPLSNPLLFNGLAIVFVLLILPITIAYTADTDYYWNESDYTNAFTQWSSGDSSIAFVENGMDLSGTYDIQEGNVADEAECAYIKPHWDIGLYSISDYRYFSGACYGDDSEIGDQVGVNSSNADSFMNVRPSSAFGKLAAEIPQTHHIQTLNHGYVGYSGDGDFSWTIDQRFNSIQSISIPNENIFAIRSIMLDESNSYACSDGNFADIYMKYHIELWYSGQLLQFDFESYQSNGIELTTGSCNPTLRLDYNFTSMDISEISIHNNNDWYNTTIIMTIDKLQRVDNQPFGSTYTPFGGIDEYTHTLDYVVDENADVVQGLSNVALIMGIGMGVLGLASTTYWNPVVDSFRRFQV
jgi:hypothetical protein